MTAAFEIERTLPRVFLPFVGARNRYQGISGGRGSGKSHFFVDDLVLDTLGRHTRAACLREVQNSIKDSVKQLIEDKIRLYKLPEGRHGWVITDREIVYTPTDSLFIFRGLQNHTAASIKSLEGFNHALFEEAQTISARSLELATPTFRTDAIMRFAWNPGKKDDPVDKLFHENADDPAFLWRRVNFYDNPLFPAGLKEDMLRDRRRDPDKYAHVWLGKYEQRSESRVFRNWRIAKFETPASARFMFGGDWGFSVDPTVLVRCFAVNRTVYVDQEVYKVGCDIDDTPALFAGTDTQTPPRWANRFGYKGIEGSMSWPLIVDSARPETISYMRKRGFSRMTPAIKGPGSVEEGIEFLKSYDIIVHPRCVHTIDELSTYAYKVDKKTDEILPQLADENNHVIDSLRYAVENLRRSSYTLANIG